jgi:hypothetical protein
MSETVDLICLHEAGHCIAARIVGIEVVSAVAGDDPGVRTRHRPATTPAEDMSINERLVLIDLAGAAAEWMRLRQVWATDERNAMGRALAIVILRRGLARDVEVTSEMREEAAELVERLRVQAADMVEKNLPLIVRVAGALAGGATLTQADIDDLMQET